MSDTSMDKIYKAIGMCRAHGLHGTEVLLLDLAARATLYAIIEAALAAQVERRKRHD